MNTNRQRINGEPYIHHTWRDSIVNGVKDFDMDVKAIYTRYAQQKKAALERALGMNTTEAGKIVGQITGFYDLIEKNGDALTQQFLKTGINAANAARMTNPNSLKKFSQAIVNDTNWMKATLKNMQAVLDQSDGFNEGLIEYFKSKAINPKSLMSKGVKVENLKIMDLEKKTGTSLVNLKKTLDTLNGISSQYQLPLEPSYVGEIDKLMTNTEFKSVSNAIRSSGQRILNTQGFLLEGVMWGLMEGAVHDGLIKGIEGKGIEVNLVGGEGGKTDLALQRLAENNQKINIGFSMKSTQKGIVSAGYYGKHSLQTFYQMAQVLDQQEEYVYDNMIANGKTRLRLAGALNRLIAARAAWEAVTGKAGDEIYFFVYLNKIVSAEEMYENMASGTENGFQLAIGGVTEIPAKNVLAVDAYTRSHNVLTAIRSLKNVQIVTKK